MTFESISMRTTSIAFRKVASGVKLDPKAEEELTAQADRKRCIFLAGRPSLNTMATCLRISFLMASANALLADCVSSFVPSRQGDQSYPPPYPPPYPAHHSGGLHSDCSPRDRLFDPRVSLCT